MRYAFVGGLLSLLLLLSLTAAHAAVQSPGGSSSPQLQTTSHDVSVKYVSLVGPAAVSLSDTNGRYMWVLSALRNHSAHNELIKMGVTFGGVMPDGCVRADSLVLPGQTSFFLSPGDEKTLIWRVRYSCHAPATMQTVRETVSVAVTHCDPSTSEPGPAIQPTPGGVCPENSQPEGSEANVANNAATASKQILVQ